MMLMTRTGDLPRDDGPLGGGDDQVPGAGATGGGRPLLRLGHRRRRQRHAARRVHPSRPVGGDDQAALHEIVRAGFTAIRAWKTFLHSCGSVYHLLPHFIEAGIDILNPVQTSAANMEPARLKAEFGEKIVFWGGGCDTQSVLAKATPEQVRVHVAERLHTFAPGGGYVFNQVHNIQSDVPAENIIAMFDAAYASGAY